MRPSRSLNAGERLLLMPCLLVTRGLIVTRLLLVTRWLFVTSGLPLIRLSLSSVQWMLPSTRRQLIVKRKRLSTLS